MCLLGTLMSLKLDYANICGGQTKAQWKQIHKIIKEILVFFYFSQYLLLSKHILNSLDASLASVIYRNLWWQ